MKEIEAMVHNWLAAYGTSIKETVVIEHFSFVKNL